MNDSDILDMIEIDTPADLQSESEDVKPLPVNMDSMEDTSAEEEATSPLMRILPPIDVNSPVKGIAPFVLDFKIEKNRVAQNTPMKWDERNEHITIKTIIEGHHAVFGKNHPPLHLSKKNYRLVHNSQSFALNHTYLVHPNFGLLKKIRRLGKGAWGSVSLFANQHYQFAVKKFVSENEYLQPGQNTILPFEDHPTTYMANDCYCITHEEQHAIHISQIAGLYRGHYQRIKWGVYQDSFEQFNYSQEMLYMMMPFYKGITIGQYFNSNNLDKCDRVCIALAIALELEKYQNKNLVHGDLHYNNILIDIDNDTPIIHIIDWDIAIQLQNSEQTLTQCEKVENRVYETKAWKWNCQPAHMPPEFSDGRRSLKFDIYSLGVLFKNKTGIDNHFIGKMLDENPNMRPTISKVVTYLRNQLQILQSESITWQRDHQRSIEQWQQKPNEKLPTLR